MQPGSPWLLGLFRGLGIFCYAAGDERLYFSSPWADSR